MEKETIIQEIIHADLQTLYNLLEPIKDETKELQAAYKILKNGRTIKYHVEWNLKGHIDIRERQGIVLLQGKEIPLEEWWDEEEDRRSEARKALLEYYSEEDAPYKGR